MAQPSVSARMNEVLTLSKKVSSSVMGLAFSTLCDTKLNDLIGQEDFIRDIKDIDSAEDMRNFLKEMVTDPLAHQVKAKAKDQLKEFKDKSAELKDAVDNSATERSTGIGPNLARRNSEATIEVVKTKTRAIMKAERIINGLKLAINALEDNEVIGDEDTTDEDVSDGDKQATVSTRQFNGGIKFAKLTLELAYFFAGLQPSARWLTFRVADDRPCVVIRVRFPAKPLDKEKPRPFQTKLIFETAHESYDRWLETEKISSQTGVWLTVRAVSSQKDVAG